MDLTHHVISCQKVWYAGKSSEIFSCVTNLQKIIHKIKPSKYLKLNNNKYSLRGSGDFSIQVGLSDLVIFQCSVHLLYISEHYFRVQPTRACHLVHVISRNKVRNSCQPPTVVHVKQVGRYGSFSY